MNASIRHTVAVAPSAHAVARGLGWFSIALGLAETLAPRAMARWLGMEGRETLLRAYGLRELAVGAGILAVSDPTPLVWGRVAGDTLDIATLGAYAGDDNPQVRHVNIALAAVAGITAIDAACARALSAQQRAGGAVVPDYSGRRGLPMAPELMRGAARDFVTPKDMRAPAAMRPLGSG
jgi:hypothetical protein